MRAEDQVAITLPATSANLGPGFDAVALAMNLRLRVSARRGSAFSVHATGRDTDVCGTVANNLIISTYCDTLEALQRRPAPLHLTIANDIPIGKGCGSSAAARIVGLVLANHFGRLRWSDQRLLAAAAGLEGHGDNVAACWCGGVTVVGNGRDAATLNVANIPVRSPKSWRILLAVPPTALATEEARKVLPSQYSRCDVVTNIQNAMLLVAAFGQGNRRWLSHAMDDRIHEPYRNHLCPLLACLKSFTGNHGIVGVCLSGAGPSVLLFLDAEVTVSTARRIINARLKEQGLDAQLFPTTIATGIRIRVSASSKR
jgi:homoserine kinase